MNLLDTNYILRFLLRDNEEMYETASKVIKSERCFVLEGVLAEVVYVLHGVYEIPKKIISQTLTQFITLDNIFTHEPESLFVDALQMYQTKNLDYVDCCLCALKRDYEVRSFDKKLMRCVDLP